MHKIISLNYRLMVVLVVLAKENVPKYLLCSILNALARTFIVHSISFRLPFFLCDFFNILREQ